MNSNRNITSILKALVGIYLVNAAACYKLNKLGSFPITYPAYTNIYSIDASGFDRYNLLISTFEAGPKTTGSVQIVEGIGRYLGNVSAIKPKVVTTRVTWPNEISGIPEQYFKKKLLVIPDGFLLPYKGDGSIFIMDISQDDPKGPYAISGHSAFGWFYHRVIWKDMDMDGDMDILTCRAREPITGIGKDSELLWFENENNLQSAVWRHHVIDHGPDVFFRNAKLQTSDGPKDCIITAQFFTKKLAIYWNNSLNGSWPDPSQVKSRVIDDTIGGVFEVQIEDLNADGKLDLLVTNNGNNGSVFAYEIPDDFRNENFTRHTLATGFSPRKQGPGKGAPGQVKPVFPYTRMSNKTKPSILLSGDDDGRAYLLEPRSSRTSDWTYNLTVVLDAGDGTVGEISFADVDSDGYNEVFVPSYNTNKLFVYKFSQ